jgi:hypothetical protein
LRIASAEGGEDRGAAPEDADVVPKVLDAAEDVEDESPGSVAGGFLTKAAPPEGGGEPLVSCTHRLLERGEVDDAAVPDEVPEDGRRDDAAGGKATLSARKSSQLQPPVDQTRSERTPW